MEVDEGTLNTLLGYLTDVQWADALRNHSEAVNRDTIYRLLEMQEKAFGFHIKSTVQLFEEDEEEFKRALKEK